MLFHLVVSMVALVLVNGQETPCGGNLNTPQGTFVSPNYPNNFDGYQYCKWTMDVLPGYKVKLVFNKIDLEIGPDDCLDYLKISTVLSNGTSLLISTLCGNYKPPDIDLQDIVKVEILFFSHQLTTGKGFKVSWEKFIDNPCRDGWHLYQEGNSCVKAFDDVAKTWDEARAECQTHDGDLVKTDNPVIRDLVADLLSKGRRYWMGLHGDNTGDFEWVDGQEQTSFQWWTCRQPSNNYMEQCVEMIGSKRGRWNDMECSRKRSFVCQVPTNEPPPTTVTTMPTTVTTTSTTTGTPETRSCDFESEEPSLCIFKNSGAKYVWKRQQAITATRGPRQDHSGSSQGHYLILTGPYKHQYNSLQLINKTEENSCLRFWYVLEGDVKVFIRGGQDSTEDTFTGTDDEWVHSMIDITAAFEYPYIAATTSDHGYMAIDDVRLDNKPCAIPGP